MKKLVNLFISCFKYGRPDSIFVNLVGRNLVNFLEYERENTATIADKDYTIVYFKKTHDLYTMANHHGDESYLILKKLSGESKKIIFQGNLGHEIKNVFINKNINHLYYTFIDNRKDIYKAYLITYDLNKMTILNKTIIMDRKKYDKGQFLGGGGIINKCIFDEEHNKIIFQINYKLETGYYEGKDYLSHNINTGIVEEISENEYKASLEFLQTPNSSFSYVSGNIVKKLFIISPQSDFLPANYKHKYNGIYIYDGTNNIRISKMNNISFYLDPVHWIENGNFIIWNSYLFDTSGKLKEDKITDGTVLAIY